MIDKNMVRDMQKLTGYPLLVCNYYLQKTNGNLNQAIAKAEEDSVQIKERGTNHLFMRLFDGSYNG